MKILHILRTEPDENLIRLIQNTTNGDRAVEIPLYDEQLDWSALVDQIMDADRVISWW